MATASIIFFVCAHYIIERLISMRSAKKGGQTNDIVTILSILVSSMIVYAAAIFTSIVTQNTLGLLTLVWGIMVMGAFSGIVFNLTFKGKLREFDTMVVFDCLLELEYYSP